MADEPRRMSPIVRGIAFGLLLVGAVALWMALDPGFRAGRNEAATGELSQDEFERRVRAYLLDHPEVLVEAMQGLQARQRAAAQTEVQAVLAERADEIFRDAEAPVGGNAEGDVTLVEFFDYNCPYCRQVARVLHEAAAGDGRLRVVYKEFPILGPNSVFAAKAALAAHRQQRYLPFHEALMRVRGTVNQEAVLAAAAEIGLDVEHLRADIEDSAIQAAIDRNMALATALRISGTPSFVIGNEVVRGAVDLRSLQGAIRRAREGGRAEDARRARR